MAFGQSRLVGFYDVGGIRLHENTRGLAIATATGKNNYTLSGAGLGIEINKGERYQFRLIWARKLGSNSGGTVDGMNADGRSLDNQFWVQGSLWF